MRDECYYPYFMLFINPTREGKALVSTCCNNFFRRENCHVVDAEILDTWNSVRFRFQRKLLSTHDWSHCIGSDCAYIPYDAGDKFATFPDVRDAIAKKETLLGYFPKKLFLVPTLQCNNNCYFCYCRKYRLGGGGAYRSFTLSTKLLQEIKEKIVPVVEAITLSGGEAFYAPESLDLIEAISSYSPEKNLSVFTNGTLLHRFGIQRIMRRNIGLRVSFYGMSRKTYRMITGVDLFTQMYDNVRALLSEGYPNIVLIYVLSSRTVVDIEPFCEFVIGSPSIKYGLIHTNFYEGRKYHSLMKTLARKYASESARLIFDRRDEHVSKMILRKLYDPIHAARYRLWRFSQGSYA